MPKLPTSCPCGTGASYATCCGPLHGGDAAPTAESLMRSRYSAYVVADVPYLLATWHRSTRPPGITRDPALRWLGLDVLEARGGLFDTEGTVEFRARHDRGVVHERSSFVHEGGRWYYVDGIFPARS